MWNLAELLNQNNLELNSYALKIQWGIYFILKFDRVKGFYVSSILSSFGIFSLNQSLLNFMKTGCRYNLNTNFSINRQSGTSPSTRCVMNKQWKIIRTELRDIHKIIIWIFIIQFGKTHFDYWILCYKKRN